MADTAPGPGEGQQERVGPLAPTCTLRSATTPGWPTPRSTTAFAEHYSVEGLTLLTAEPTVLHSDPDAVQTVAYCSSRLSAVVY